MPAPAERRSGSCAIMAAIWKVFAAEAEVAANVGIEADEELVGDDDVVAGERLGERHIAGSRSTEP